MVHRGPLVSSTGRYRVKLHFNRALLLCVLIGSYDAVLVAATASFVESSAVLTVEAIAAMAVGGAMCLAGYRFLSATAFAYSFLFGGVAAAYVLASFVSPTISIAVGGVAAGALCLLSRRVGRWIVGASGGCAIAYVLYAFTGDKLSPDDPARALVGLSVGFGVAGAATVWRFPVLALIVSSSVMGAALVLLGTAHFIKNFPDAESLAAFRQTKDSSQPWLAAVPRAWWSYLLMFVAYSAIGAHVQRHRRARAVPGRR